MCYFSETICQYLAIDLEQETLGGGGVVVWFRIRPTPLLCSARLLVNVRGTVKESNALHNVHIPASCGLSEVAVLDGYSPQFFSFLSSSLHLVGRLLYSMLRMSYVQDAPLTPWRDHLFFGEREGNQRSPYARVLVPEG
jgi:hypothetical protein